MACNTCKSTNSCSCGKSVVTTTIDCNGKHITELPSLLSPADGDLIYIYDASTGESKSWTLEALYTYLSSVIEVTPPLVGTLTPGIFGDSKNTAVVEVSPDGLIVNVSETPILLELDELTDVDTTGVGVGDVLSWNGSEWVPYTIPATVPTTTVDMLYTQESSSASVLTATGISDPKVISNTFNVVLDGDPGDVWHIEVMLYMTYAPQTNAIQFLTAAAYNTNPLIVSADPSDVPIPASYYYNMFLNDAVGNSNCFISASSKFMFTQTVANQIIKPKVMYVSADPVAPKVFNRIITAHKIS